MRFLTSALVAGFMFGGAASAATIDLTDEVFAAGSVTYSFAGPINGFAEEADGVTFTFATSGQFRNIGPWLSVIDPASPALTFGGGGGNTASWTMTVSEDVTLNSYNGVGPLNDANITSVFDVIGGSVSSIGNTFDNFGGSTDLFGTATDFAFASGPLALEAGTIYTFNTTNSSANTNAHIFSFDFTKPGTDPVAPVPLPAGLPLLLAGLGALGIARRRKG